MKPDIKNQKVFVTLSAITQIQREYTRLWKLAEEIRKNGRDPSTTVGLVRGMGIVIRELGLPIDIYH